MSWGHHPGSYGGQVFINSGTQLQRNNSIIGSSKSTKKAPNTLPLSMKPSYQSKENVLAEIRRLDSLLGRKQSRVNGSENEKEWK